MPQGHSLDSAVTAAKGKLDILTRKLDRNLHGAEYSAQGHCIFATVEDRGCSHLCSISLTGAEEEEVTTVVGGEVSVSSWEIVGDTIVTSIATATHPNEIFVVDGHPSQKDRCAHLFSSHSFSDTNTDASRERPTSKLD